MKKLKFNIVAHGKMKKKLEISWKWLTIEGKGVKFETHGH